MSNQFDTVAYARGYADSEAGRSYVNPYEDNTEEYGDYLEGYGDADLDQNDGE
jgi:ribosome modulation factor